MCANPIARQQASQRGFTLIELLVGLIVAALVGLAALSTAIFVSARQKQGVSAAGTSAALITALSGVKAEIGAAGLGFLVDKKFRCARLNMSDDMATPSADNAVFSPLQIARGASGYVDVLDVAYATDINGMAPVRLANDASPNEAALLLRSWLPVPSGQKVLIASEDPASTCTIRNVTAGTGAGGTPAAPWKLELQDTFDFSVPLTYAANSTVSVLGGVERRKLSVNASGQLMLESSTLGGEAALIDGVVAFRVQYGVAAVGSTSIVWQEPTGTWAAGSPDVDLLRVRAIRLGVVARSPQAQKQCDVNTVAPQLFGESIDLSADANWNCHNYRRAEVVVPLRNTAWAGS